MFTSSVSDLVSCLWNFDLKLCKSILMKKFKRSKTIFIFGYNLPLNAQWTISFAFVVRVVITFLILSFILSSLNSICTSIPDLDSCFLFGLVSLTFWFLTKRFISYYGLHKQFGYKTFPRFNDGCLTLSPADLVSINSS